MKTILTGFCKACNCPVEKQDDDTPEEQKGFCSECINKAKKLGAMNEIMRRSKERNVSINVIVDELIEYALDIQKKIAEHS